MMFNPENSQPIEIDSDSDYDQQMEIDGNHNIDKYIEYLPLVPSIILPAVEHVRNIPYTMAKMNSEIITISDSDDNDSEDANTDAFQANFESQMPSTDAPTPTQDASMPKIDSDTENPITEPEPISARITRSYTRPNLKSYNEDDPSIVFIDQSSSSHLSVDFPRSTTKPLFHVEADRIPRNTDKKVFYSNYLFKSMCFLCGCTDRRLAVHYARKHQGTEVFIARVSPRMAARMRGQNYEFIKVDENIHGMCVFCEEVKKFKRDDWMKHLLMHTGEQPYYCHDCNTPMAKKSRHGNCPRDNVHQIFDAESSSGDIVGFICNTCNYVQIQQHQMNKHMAEHTSFDASFDELFSRIILVKSPL